MHLKYFRTPLFWETEAKFVRFGNFPHTLTYRGCVENCQIFLQFLKTGMAENNIFFLRVFEKRLFAIFKGGSGVPEKIKSLSLYAEQ